MTTSKGLIALLLVTGLAVGACGDEAAQPDGTLVVVATTTILGDVVTNIVGDHATVEVLTPAGADPHEFRASASQVATINGADLVVANGLGLEEGLTDVLEAAVTDGVRVFEVAPLLEPIPFTAADGDHDSGEGHEHLSDDPHVWMDPIRMATAARIIAAQLAEIAPQIDWESTGEAYALDLEAANVRIEKALSTVADRRLVTNHESMGYFADRYGFQVLGTVVPGGSSLGDPSSEELAHLVELMLEEEVRVIFAETTQPAQLADAVAAELGEDVEVVSLYTGSLGEPGSGADTLIGMLETNARLIADALS